MLKPELRMLQEQYDVHMEETTLKQARARRELEHQLAEEEYASLKQIIAEAHHLHRTGQASKMELREALRQYGSPKFTELWNLIPYDLPTEIVETYSKIGDTITFYRTGWNWEGIDADELTFNTRFSENIGLTILDWGKDETEHMLFAAQNKVEEVLNHE